MPSLLYYVVGTQPNAPVRSGILRTGALSPQRTWSVLVAGQLLGSRREVGEVGAGLLLLGESLDGDVVVSCGLAQRTDGGLFLGDVGERVPVVPAARILVRHLVDLVVRHAVLLEHLIELLWRSRPHRVAVRVVSLPADVVYADIVAQLHTDVIGDETGQEVIPEDLRGLLLAEVLPRPRRVHLVRAVGALEEVGDPAGATLRQRDLQIGILLDRLGPQQVRRRLHD